MIDRRKMLMLMAALPLIQLTGCSREHTVSQHACHPLLLTDDHDCALCGMTIVRHPGPKGQACLRDGRLLPFCSVQDMLSWAWQPESRVAIQTLWVHDLSQTSWVEPEHTAWMDATKASYVVGHSQRGAMGHSPAPFSVKQDALAFAQKYGGKLYTLEQLNFDNFRGDSTTQPHQHHHHSM